MRVEQSKMNVQRSGKFEETQFRIKASSKAFDILSSKLYSDPHLAIVRELSTNAWDAHAEQGTEERPFDVHLPNKMEPFFYIRDYGTGMSHQDIMQLYTTYFESTKTNTNKQVGCLGLGSKSPFAYTDNFSVISWFQGKKRVYSMFKGEEGFPKVALMQTLDSDEHSGLEVRFACKVEDINLFLEKAQQVYRKFPVKPVLHGNSTFEIEEAPILMQGKGWRIYKGQRQSYAIMGYVAYPLQTNHLKGEARILVNNATIDINFPIGSLEIAANREELQYSDFTKEAIDKATSIICEEIADKISDKFEGCKTLWEARCLYKSLFHDWKSPFHHLVQSVGKKINWNGQNISQNYRYQYYIDKVGSATRYKLTSDKLNRLIVRRENEITSVNVRTNLQFMIDDTDKEPGEKIRSWMKRKMSGDTKEVLLVNLKQWDEEHEEKLHEILGTTPADFKPTSTLPKPIRKKARKGSATPAAVVKTPIESRGFSFVYNKGYFYRIEDAWQDRIIDTKSAGVYVAWRRSMIEHEGREIHPNQINNIVQILDSMNQKPIEIFAFKAGYIDRVLATQPRWEDFYTYAEKKLKEYIDKNKLEGPIKAKRGAEHIDDFQKFEEISKHLSKPSPLKTFVNMVLGAQNLRKEVELAIRLAQELRYLLPESSIESKADVIRRRYPMLKWINSGHYYGDSRNERYKDAAEYVMLVDKKKG